MANIVDYLGLAKCGGRRGVIVDDRWTSVFFFLGHYSLGAECCDL